MTQRDEQSPSQEKQPAAELLPVLYAELRHLAAALTARLTPGQTLQPTALVHEAYLRLVRDRDPGWEGRRHFFGAAAQAMREILIEQARHKGSVKHGGQARRVELAEGLVWIEPPTGDLLAVWPDFYHPMDIFQDAEQRVYVTDQVPRLSMLAPDGTLLARCRPVLNGAHGMWGDAAGNLYMAEMNPSRVTRLTPLP